VLVVHSLGEHFAPFNVMSATFRTELAQRSAEPLEFYAVSLQAARVGVTKPEDPLVLYLRALFAERKLDLIVTIGEPATQFVNRHRATLFPNTPLLAGLATRRIEISNPTNMAVVPLQINPVVPIEDLLQVRPATTNVYVVLGASPHEQFWKAALQRETARFTDRTAFFYLDDQPLEEMLERVSELPPNSAVYYAILQVDAAGVPYELDAALESLHAAANSPIFGTFEHQLGLGIVGGRLVSMEAWGREAAQTALRLLTGAQPDRVSSPLIVPGPPTYDWRELQRWGIDEELLPVGSTVRFRAPTFWEHYKWRLITIHAVCLAQAALVFLLVRNRRRLRRTQSEALEREQSMNLAASAARLALWTWDIPRDEIWTTDQARTLFGWPKNEPLKLEMFLAKLHPDDRDQVRKSLHDSLETKGTFRTEYRIINADNTIRWMAARGQVEPGPSGKPIRLRGVSVEITEQRQAERELQEHQGELAHLSRVAALSELSGSLAHELNQPLAIILSNAQAAQRLLTQEPPDLAEVRDILGDIASEDRRAGDVIKRLRAILKRGEPKRSPLRLNEAIEDVLQLSRSDLLGRGINLTRELPPHLPSVLADRIPIEQVILNLIVNACDAVTSNVPRDRRLSVSSSADATAVYFSVRDNGCGLPSDPNAVFKPFYTTKPNGLGMGLSICRTIIASHGGRLWAERNPERGATFLFSLPIPDAAT